MKVNRITQAQSYIGFLYEADGRVDLTALDWQDSDNIVNALTELTFTYPNRRIVIVWNNAKWHTSKHLRSHLGEGNPLENIHLTNLPPCAPGHNPIEHVWNEAKTISATSNALASQKPDTPSKPTAPTTNSPTESTEILFKGG